MKIKIKRLNNQAIIPTRATGQSAGYDLYACLNEPCVIDPHKTVKIGTGISIEIPDSYFGAIVARSGISTKKGLRPANCIGVCDSDYRGEYIVALHNDSNDSMVVQPNERIAQLVVMPYINVDWIECDTLNTTERGHGGFGSMGK